VGALTLINLFEVPPDADEAFVAGWERARDFLAARAAFSATALHRALREDVDFRFANVAGVEDPGAWRQAIADPGFPGREMPFASYPGLYEAVREDGRPDVAGGVRLINPFEVPDDHDDDFLTGWERARLTLRGRQGYLGTRLHRATVPARFRFVNVAGWSSPLMFARALDDPAFRDATAAIPFRSHPALYTVVRG
jgi:heme-degrading monooxygenase HmoA